jgi:hypothetical protein
VIAARLRVLQWRWGLSPGESQAAEYGTVMGLPAFERQFIGSNKARRRVEKAIAKAAA